MAEMRAAKTTIIRVPRSRIEPEIDAREVASLVAGGVWNSLGTRGKNKETKRVRKNEKESISSFAHLDQHPQIPTSPPHTHITNTQSPFGRTRQRSHLKEKEKKTLDHQRQVPNEILNPQRSSHPFLSKVSPSSKKKRDPQRKKKKKKKRPKTKKRRAEQKN